MKIVIRESGKKGKGVFASKDIRREEIILNGDYSKDTRVIRENEISELSNKDQNHVDYIGKGRYTIGYGSIFMINHSCEPNVYIKHVNFLVRRVVALRDIKKGEEICCDYVIDTMGKWKMKCHCGSNNCRKIVYSDFFKLSKHLQKKYWKYVPRWKKRMLKN